MDGEKVQIEVVDGGLMAIPVPEGKHSIVFDYFPAGLKTCSIVAAAAALLFLFLFIRGNVRLSKTNVLAMENKP